jgi:hypothetical protein
VANTGGRRQGVLVVSEHLAKLEDDRLRPVHAAYLQSGILHEQRDDLAKVGSPVGKRIWTRNE